MTNHGWEGGGKEKWSKANFLESSSRDPLSRHTFFFGKHGMVTRKERRAYVYLLLPDCSQRVIELLLSPYTVLEHNALVSGPAELPAEMVSEARRDSVLTETRHPLVQYCFPSSFSRPGQFRPVRAILGVT